MEGILFPHYKVQNKKRSMSRRLLSRKKYLQRQATNLSKSFPEIESLQNEISIVSFQNENSTQPDERYKPFATSVDVQLPNYCEKEHFLFVVSCLLIFTTIICLYFLGVFSDNTSEAYHFICA